MKQLTPHKLREIAVAAKVDPRTVKAYFAKKKQHHAVHDCIREAIERLEEGAENDDT